MKASKINSWLIKTHRLHLFYKTRLPLGNMCLPHAEICAGWRVYVEILGSTWKICPQVELRSAELERKLERGQDLP